MNHKSHNYRGHRTRGTVEILVFVKPFQQSGSVAVLLTELLSAQDTHVIGVQYDDSEPGIRAEAVGVDLTARTAFAQALVGVWGAIELRLQQPAPVEVIKLVVAPNMVDSCGAGTESFQDCIKSLVGGAAGLVEAVDYISELKDESWFDRRLRPTIQGVSEEL